MSKSGIGSWSIMRVFTSSVRVEMIKLLLGHEMLSLSDMAELMQAQGTNMSLPGLHKHLSILVKTGIVRRESGWIFEDARKTLYMLEGKGRVEVVLHELECDIMTRLQAGAIFIRTSRLARKIDILGSRIVRDERENFENMLRLCESSKVSGVLTEDEKKKVKAWRDLASR